MRERLRENQVGSEGDVSWQKEVSKEAELRYDKHTASQEMRLLQRISLHIMRQQVATSSHLQNEAETRVKYRTPLAGIRINRPISLYSDWREGGKMAVQRDQRVEDSAHQPSRCPYLPGAKILR